VVQLVVPGPSVRVIRDSGAVCRGARECRN